MGCIRNSNMGHQWTVIFNWFSCKSNGKYHWLVHNSSGKSWWFCILTRIGRFKMLESIKIFEDFYKPKNFFISLDSSLEKNSSIMGIMYRHRSEPKLWLLLDGLVGVKKKREKLNWFYVTAAGASNNPCSDTYGGPAPFSEPETAAIRDLYSTVANRVRLFLSFHSFGQYLLLPFGHQTAHSNNHANLMSVANAGANAIRGTAGMDYLVGTSSDVLCEWF